MMRKDVFTGGSLPSGALSAVVQGEAVRALATSMCRFFRFLYATPVEQGS